MNAAAMAKGETVAAAPRTTAIGALAYYVSHANPAHYEPSNITFGIMPPLAPRPFEKLRAVPSRIEGRQAQGDPEARRGGEQAPKGKKLRNEALSARALAALDEWLVQRQARHERTTAAAGSEPVEGRTTA
jgi:methylenetetrahydrofolate--tRNA-(uracil-5-)-methyltransferase